MIHQPTVTTTPLHILIVDDDRDDREFFTRLLEKGAPRPCIVDTAPTGAEGLALLEKQTYDCALLDYNLPTKDGLRILNEIRLKNPDLPVIMLTGEGNENVAVQALKSGAQDYVSKNSLSAATLHTAIAGAQDSKRKEMEFLFLASHDDLTGLANRRMFTDRLEHALHRSERLGISLGLLYLDLDGFKAINDTHGHAAGDLLLKEVAARIKESLREYDTPARMGGDEFAILLEDLPGDGVEHSSQIAHRTAESIAGEPIIIEGKKLHVGVSLGIALYPLMAKNAEDLFKLADQAMYAMKKGGRLPLNPYTDRAIPMHGTLTATH